MVVESVTLVQLEALLIALVEYDGMEVRDALKRGDDVVVRDCMVEDEIHTLADAQSVGALEKDGEREEHDDAEWEAV